jgi:hypothetical protein
MLDLLFIALFQTVAGAPEAAEPVPPTPAEAAPAEAAPTDPPATTLDGPTVPGETAGHAEQAAERTCRPATATGSRLSRRMVCSSEADRRAQQDMATRMTTSSIGGPGQ